MGEPLTISVALPQPTGVPAPVAFPSSFHFKARLAAAFIPALGVYVSAIIYPSLGALLHMDQE
jgi:hypothetical protein